MDNPTTGTRSPDTAGVKFIGPQGLFDAIKHGDTEHQDWLREAIQNYFDGSPVPPPRGSSKTAMALVGCVNAMRDVQDHWGDPGSWMHNRLETPLLVYEAEIRAAKATGAA